MNNYTDIEIIKQWLDSHWTDVLKYYGAKMKDASQVEKINWITNKRNITGMLCSYIEDGVNKVVQVTPDSFLSAMTGLSSDLVIQCRNATENAITATTYANRAGDYAMNEGAKTASLIAEITALKLVVIQQGNRAENMANYAETAGDNAQGIYQEVLDWFPSFKTEAEIWYESAQEKEIQRVSNENNRVSNETARNSAETQRKANETNRSNAEAERVNAERIRSTSESERVTNEQQRQVAESTRQQVFENTQQQRQETFEQTQADRQQAFEDAEAARMEAMLLTRFEVDPETMEAKAYLVENDPTNYYIRNGYMMMEIEI